MRAATSKTCQTIQTVRTAGRVAARVTETSAPDRRRRLGGAATTADIAEAWARRASHANGFGDAGF